MRRRKAASNKLVIRGLALINILLRRITPKHNYNSYWNIIFKFVSIKQIFTFQIDKI